MSHGFLEFADFDGAWRYSSTPSLGTAQPKHITFAGTPTLVHIRAPASRSLNLSQPANGLIATRRRRAQSESTPSTTSTVHTDTVSTVQTSTERPISAILVSFVPIAWTSSEPHPGSPANFPRNEDAEAVSPKSRVPGALKRNLGRRKGTEMFVRIVNQPLGDGKARAGTSLVAVKSPYPRKRDETVGLGMEKVKEWVKGVAGKVRR